MLQSIGDRLAIVAVFTNYNRQNNFADVYLKVLATYQEPTCTLLVTALHKLLYL